MSNVFDFTGKAVVTAPAVPAVNEDLVTMLQELLAKAKNAELLSLFVTGYQFKPGSIDLEFLMQVQTGPVHPHMLLGAVLDAQARMTALIPTLLTPAR